MTDDLHSQSLWLAKLIQKSQRANILHLPFFVTQTATKKEIVLENFCCSEAIGVIQLFAYGTEVIDLFSPLTMALIGQVRPFTIQFGPQFV